MRTPVIAGNWKLFKKQAEAASLVEALIPLVQDTVGVEIVVSPVFTSLAAVREKICGTTINLSAQNCYWEEEGAFTGEIAPGMLVDAGCSHVIIGHSERRQYFGETNETVNKKIKAALKAGLVAIFCIGETLAEREADKTFDILRDQVNGGLDGISGADLAKVIIAYEPVWAIGTGKTASDDQAQEAHAFIRSLVVGLYDQATGDAIRVLYGGSVKPENVKGLMSRPDIDGALVGGASLKADSFAGIVNFGK
jgi:triosephosphate isomerase (TIM)